MTTPTRHSKVFLDAAHLVASGKADRVQISTELGINPGTFAVWMSRSKITMAKGPDGVKKLHGAALKKSITDPHRVKLLEEVVAAVLDGKMSATEASENYPELTQATISKRVRKYRLERGMTVQKRRTKAEMALSRLTVIG